MLTADGVEYLIDEFGIHQVNVSSFSYDENYINKAYFQSGDLFSFNKELLNTIRVNYIANYCKSMNKILEVGYGGGDFLKAFRTKYPSSILYGYDIITLPAPEGVISLTSEKEIFSTDVDVVCMFDVYEHISDLSFVSKLNTKYLVLSLPYCHYRNLGLDWFSDWKHRKPNEHIHHFDDITIQRNLERFGYKKIDLRVIEDIIRKPIDSNPNILSCIFEKV